MPTVILARHGRTGANAKHILAGRTKGVHLDDLGARQASEVAARLTGLNLVEAVSSPMERCRETAKLMLAGTGVRTRVDRRLTECDYGDWTGKPMKQLVKEDLWKVVQAHPAGVRFPGGEAMAEMSARAVASVREHDRRIAEKHGADAIWLVVSHGDVIKSVLADALGIHLDGFQRIMVDPASLSVVHYTELCPLVLATNSRAGTLNHLVTRDEKPGKTLGGGAG